MKYMNNYIRSVLGMIFFTIGVQISRGQLVSFECHSIPDNPAMFTGFKIRASGEFYSTGWYYWKTTPNYTLSSNRLTIRLECYRDPAYYYLLVYTPWQLDIQIGTPESGLEPGGYRANVIMTSLNYGHSETSMTAFIVGYEPAIKSFTPSNQSLVLSWEGDPTLLYSVQSSTQLTANSWKHIPSYSNVPCDSYSNMQYQATTSNDSLRMFRLIYTPK